MAKQFTRKASATLVAKLINEPLFKKKLMDDCLKEKLFMAIRNEVIDFYYKGGRLFEFGAKGDFKTHIKYAAVLNSNRNYLTQGEIKELMIAPDFIKDYGRIKENCSKYSGIEASCISNIYHGNSYLNSEKSIVVLDIEAVFDSTSTKKRTDRIDIVLYNKNNQRITFVEAKNFSNSEIWSKSTAKVVSQVGRYEAQIKLQKNTILKEYTNYIHIINFIFNVNIPLPKEIDEEVILLIFGFDSKQAQKMKSITFISSLEGVKVYRKGDPKSIILSNLLTEAKYL